MAFKDILFKGTFRDYQQRVLDNSSRFLLDHKINIVAAPGSGKTILGLELIRRLNAPCLIFSPTVTIRQQWGQRFKESFLTEHHNFGDYVSYDLNNIKLINSITYQALHSAMAKIRISSEEETIDYSKIDLFKVMIEKNITTICLDEAHHLQNEWQKSLSQFIKKLPHHITIISLTATPPYDASPAEWDRYIETSGEIDEEIFVPELVKENTLCPHQDYIVFNYPIKKEIASFENHRIKAVEAIDEVSMLYFIEGLNKRINQIYQEKPDFLYANFSSVVALYIFLAGFKKKYNKKIFYELTNTKKVPELNLMYSERAIQFLVDSELLSEDEKEQVKQILKKHSLFTRNKVHLDLNNRLKRSLISSCGKLDSISKIVKLEHDTLSDRLRMLILTDYIKREAVSLIGKNTSIDNISIVSIFEQIRTNNTEVVIGCLSGSLVILPLGLEEVLSSIYHYQNFTVQPIASTEYGIFNFKGDSRTKVELVSKLFEDGHLKVLIGTQALLGEGWDSPCINSLILASFVGSFMLSNQMRGRAIRKYAKDPNKTANIWHLVTVEPEYVFESGKLKKLKLLLNEDKSKIYSSDYETLVRRFDCFVGPNYETGEIESGIERITYIKPPFTKNNFTTINNKTFQLAQKRDELATIWNNTLTYNTKTVMESRVPKELKVPVFTFTNMLLLTLVTTLLSTTTILLTRVINVVIQKGTSIIELIVLVFLILGIIEKSYGVIKFIAKHISPSKSLISISRTILKTFKDLELIQEGAQIKVQEDDYRIFTSIHLKKATIYEQNLFNTAIKELLSPIKNPKYLIIKKNIFNRYDYRYSFACPSAFSTKASDVDIFRNNLKKSLGALDVKYAYNEKGRALLVKCRSKSFITKNESMIKKRHRVTRFD